jgi:hypothetical protein
MAGEERRRLATERLPWLRWGPYLAERAWGTVREDYSADGQPWTYFTHDQARSRAYRWNEEGLGGICDIRQFLCFAFAFWNGRDPILKERIFGLTGPEGNHGEDAKEYWWYLDSTPTHSWMQWRYHYPQAAFPYDRLVAENARRTRLDPEFELLDTGIFDDGRYWQIDVDYAKAGTDDICIALRARNAGPEPATLHVLPTLWFRNMWAWGLDDAVPELAEDDGRLVATHVDLGRYVLVSDPGADTLFCDNETNNERLFQSPSRSPYRKDGINDHVVAGANSVNPAKRGTKAALHHVITVAPGETAQIRMRLKASDDAAGSVAVDSTWDATMAARRGEADDFYGRLIPAEATPDEAMIVRQAMAGMLWSKQFYHYDIERWLDGDPAGPVPPASRETGRNSAWCHLNNRDVISMPDSWEYPWYAAWDLAFHCVALAHVDPEFAKEQLVLLCREWFMHPNGQLPAYEWGFGDVNPPVHAWAALHVYEIDGSRDHAFLERVLHKLLLNFTWWVNRKDADGNNVFEGGFLGLDNIGPIDRSAQLPDNGVLEQSDGTSWMALFCLNLLEISIRLAQNDVTYTDLATKFFEHFAYIASAIYGRGLWNDEDGFYYDVLRSGNGQRIPLRVRSMVGLLPLCATTAARSSILDRLPDFDFRFHWFVANKPQYAERVSRQDATFGTPGYLLSIVDTERLVRMLSRMLDEQEFLSPYGLRSLSAQHRDEPFRLHIDGLEAAVNYEPAESTTPLFGGNSNWRGPVWFPVNYLLVEALRRFDDYLGDEFVVEYPTGSGDKHTLRQVAHDLGGRLVALYLPDAAGNRPAFGGDPHFAADGWKDQLLFFEYFDGDTGKGLGASHQTGWTGLIADIILRRHGVGESP